MRSCWVVVSVALVALMPMFLGTPTASATAPLPPFERSIEFNGTYAVMEDELFRKQPTIPQRCVRSLVCVGPFDPDIDIYLGKTGFLVESNHTNVTLGHDPSRHFEYGPYTVTGLFFDDIRACAAGCIAPMPPYANVTIDLYAEVWLLGSPYWQGGVEYERDLYEYPNPIPRSLCLYAQSCR